MFGIAIYFMLVVLFMSAVIWILSPWILSPCIYSIAYLSVIIIKLIIGAFKKLRKVFK